MSKVALCELGTMLSFNVKLDHNVYNSPSFAPVSILIVAYITLTFGYVLPKFLKTSSSMLTT